MAGLARCAEKDIRRAWEALQDAVHPVIHVFIATSDIHMEYKLNMTREQVLQKIRGGTQDALWQRMALTLAQRYEPELFASLTDSAQGMRADVRLEGEKAPAQVRQARKRAAEAAQPE